MTIQEARKILGKMGNDRSDEQVMGYIETAELFKDVFFSLQSKTLIEVSGNPQTNMP